MKYKEWGAIHDVTYNELSNRVDALGTALLSLEEGLGRVAIIGENSYHWICAYLAVLCSEGTVVPVDSELPFSEILSILDHSDCTTVFFDRSFMEKFEESVEVLPKVKNFICFQLRAHEEKGKMCFYEALVYKDGTLILVVSRKVKNFSPVLNME